MMEIEVWVDVKRLLIVLQELDWSKHLQEKEFIDFRRQLDTWNKEEMEM